MVDELVCAVFAASSSAREGFACWTKRKWGLMRESQACGLLL